MKNNYLINRILTEQIESEKKQATNLVATGGDMGRKGARLGSHRSDIRAMNPRYLIRLPRRSIRSP